MLPRSIIWKLGYSLNLSRRSIWTSSILRLRKGDLDDGGESDSEKWLKYASDNEDPLSGNISAFEDEFGNLIRPTGELTKSIALRKLKRKSDYDRVSSNQRSISIY